MSNQLDDEVWSVHASLQLSEWSEPDAVVYRRDSGDLHVVSGVTKLLISSLISTPQSLPSLLECLNSSDQFSCDAGFVQRHLLQLEALGLIGKNWA